MLSCVFVLYLFLSIIWPKPYNGWAKSFWEEDEEARKVGDLKWVWSHKDGRENGVRTEWDREGNKRSENMFVDGKLNGLSIQFHDNGQKKEEVTLKNGKEVEETVKFWNRRGEFVVTADDAEAE